MRLTKVNLYLKKKYKNYWYTDVGLGSVVSWTGLDAGICSGVQVVGASAASAGRAGTRSAYWKY